jgi:CRISPR-associated protein Cmr2
MVYDCFAFFKKERFTTNSYQRFRINHNLYFLHGKRDKVLNIKSGQNKALLFKHLDTVYNLRPESFWQKGNIQFLSEFLKTLSFSLTLTSPFFTASENKFYSVQNPIAKERPTGLPVLKGSSLKGALRQAAVEGVEDELMEGYFEQYKEKSEEQILEIEDKDKFFFKKRAKLVRLFGNEKEAVWFTLKTLLATGGVRNVARLEDILQKITGAFQKYLKREGIVDKEGACRGRLIFEDLYFTKVALVTFTLRSSFLTSLLYSSDVQYAQSALRYDASLGTIAPLAWS